MMVNTVAIMSPGDMGHAVGQVLSESGIDVITCTDGRSQRTKNLAEMAGLRQVATLEDMVIQADLVLSIMVPSKAMSFVREISPHFESSKTPTYFADCNAVSPQSALAMAEVINQAGGKFIDGGIIGTAPTKGDTPRFYVSGPDASVVMELDGRGIIVKAIGNKVGQASGIKMCYAALTKGTNTLHVALLTAASRMGLTDDLRKEFEFSQKSHLAAMEKGISRLPANAHRWIGEMEEIAATFENLGVTPNFHKGAAEIYKMLNSTPFAKESPETIDKDRTTWDTIEAVSKIADSDG
ncbi:MAG: NAD(P)-dependent oxidoreductase [SAR202 cluster bacterium]|nr:MAG: NAD(P)-dependent oxidoreductase [SAR202 cluster bacterium]MEC7734164.1 DUF1932 domain-containing protein [Chloroflexota bacterium]